MMGVLRTVYFWLSFWTYTALLFLKMIYLKLAYYGKSDFDLSLACHRVACQWGQGILKITPGWSYRIEGREYLPQDRTPMVLVANHQSSTDICALFTTGVQFRWLSKIEVFKAPIIGLAMKWSGYVPIKRGSSKSHRQALKESSSWLRRGVSMVYFPEGSRSEDGNLHSFKLGAFSLATRENVPVLPVVLQGTGHMMAKNSLFPNPANVTVKILPPTRKEEGETIEEFAERVRSLILNQLQPHPSAN